MKSYKIKTLLFTSGIAICTMAGCSNTETNENITESESITDTSDTSTDQIPAQTEPAIQEPQQEEIKEPESGTRLNPIPFKEAVSLTGKLYSSSDSAFYTGDIIVGITEVIRGEQAYKVLVSENQFNEPAPEGYEWILIKTKVKLEKYENPNASFWLSDADFSVVSESGDINDDVSAVTPNELGGEMYEGNLKEGYISGVVKKGEKASLRYENMFFSLQ